jgi:hypothetical protein
MTTPSADAICRVLDAVEALGCDECFLVPATCDLAEVERAAELIDRRG